MESAVSEMQEIQTRALIIKVHMSMCTQLLELVDRISSIIPDIEAAKPRCSLGLQALSQLHVAIETAKERVQNCCMSSKLYLAITGETVKSRLEKAKKLMEQHLSQLQNMVPVALKLKISEILVDLRGKKFSVDSCEDLAGKALRAILQLNVSPIDSVGNSEIELLQFAASMLRLSSQKDLVIERRCLKKMLNDAKEGNSNKNKTLKYLLHLLRKYDKLIVQGRTRNLAIQYDESVKSDGETITQSHGSGVDQVSFLRRPDPPEGFKCPLSLRLMHDPVIISSGQTYERAYIQKWFDDGHDTCPRSGMKLSNLSLTSNTPMREWILKWCMEYGIENPCPNINTSIYGSLETSDSFRSTASSMKDIDLLVDMSNLSLGSLDSSYSNISHDKHENSYRSIKELSVVEPRRFLFYPSIDDIRTKFLSNLRELPWELQCRAIQDVTTYLIDFNPSCASVSFENFLDPLITFLGEALDKQDTEAQKSGSQLFLTFLQAKRREPIHLNEDVYTLLASFLETEVAAETLALMEVLSTQVSFSNFAASGALTSILKVLDSHKRDLQESALKILYILSSKIGSLFKFASDWVPKLVPFLEDTSVSGTCLGILENLCQFEETRITIAETQGCLSSIVKLLEKSNCRDQEHAVRILLNLCSQREYYCQMVMRENCISALYDISVKGSHKGKAIASELLRQLMDTSYEEDEQECPRSNVDVSGGHRSSKSSGFIRRLFKNK